MAPRRIADPHKYTPVSTQHGGTEGREDTEKNEEWKHDGEYLNSHRIIGYSTTMFISAETG
jgi:hypothetical protein